MNEHTPEDSCIVFHGIAEREKLALRGILSQTIGRDKARCRCLAERYIGAAGSREVLTGTGFGE